MALFLVQHGKSLSKEEDSEQGLSSQGIEEVRLIANAAAGYGVKVSQIQYSVKKRARQTAEIFRDALKPHKGLVESKGLKPMDDPAVFAENIRTADNLMLAGHLPFMEKLTAYLITGSMDKPVFKFQNGGIVCLDEYAETSSWIIKWALMPRIG